MTQTLKKQNTEIYSGFEYYTKFYKSQNGFKSIILDFIFRNISLTKNERIHVLTKTDYDLVNSKLDIPTVLIHKYCSRFLVNLVQIKKFLNKYPYVLKSRNQERKVLIYLRKIYRLAPVFDYKRAKENTRRLRKKLDYLCFWPQVMTQVAVVIYITDLLDKKKPQKIIQSNLRALCCCSAYAFHRTRNRIGLTTKYIKNL